MHCGSNMGRIDAVSNCATDIEIIFLGLPAMINGQLTFNQGFTSGHESIGTIDKLGPSVDEYAVGDRVTVEAHAECRQSKRCREGMFVSCHMLLVDAKRVFLTVSNRFQSLTGLFLSD